MSINFNHPSNTVTSTDTMTITVQGGSVSSPKPLRLNATSVIMPVGRQPAGEAGAMMYDSSTATMKYYNGTEWIAWEASASILEPIKAQLTDLFNKMGTKVDTVSYSTSAIPTASISGTTLNIVFPTGAVQQGSAGLFTSSPTGSISYYSLTSGQSMASVREQLGGSSNSQAGRNGSAAAPYITSTGWCLADGNYWTWQGSTGAVTMLVPAMNNTPGYLKSTGANGVTKTDAILNSSGSIGNTALSINQMPNHSFSVSGSTNVAGSHTHGIASLDSIRMSVDDVRVGVFRTGYNEYSAATAAGGDHAHTFSGTTNALGGNEGHTHTLNDVDVAHYNVAVLYNIAQPALALTQTAGDARYVRKTGDTMTGALRVASSLSLADNQTNLVFWMLDNSGNERGVLYHSNVDNAVRIRARGGNEFSVLATGITASNLTLSGTMTANSVSLTNTISAASGTFSGALSSGSINSVSAGFTGNATVSGTLTVGGAFRVNNNSVVTGNLNAGSLNTGDAAVSASLTVGGGFRVNNNAVITGNMNAGSFNTGNAGVSGTLTVSDAVTMYGTATIGGGFRVNNNAVVTNNLNAGSLNAGNTGISGSATVTGTLTIGSTTTLGGVLIVNNNTALNGTVSTGALTVAGQITASGDIWAFSDRKLKENIRPITNASSILSQITGIFGNMIDDPEKIEKSMVIAQEVQKVFPQAVSTDDNGFLKVNYIALIPLLISAFNERNN